MKSLGCLVLLLLIVPLAPAEPFYRVFVSTDLGGDPDDIQSLYRLLHYSDVLGIEGIISSPGPGAENDAEKIRHWIREIRIDEMRNNGHPELISEQQALSLVEQGQQTPGAPSSERSTPGSKLLIERAHADSERPLWVLVWGSLTDVSQALHDDPSIAGKIRIYYIGSNNTRADVPSRDWLRARLDDQFANLWWIENGLLPVRSTDTFRGVYQGGVQDGEWGNQEFVRVNIRGRGAAGDAFPLATSPRGSLKEGDSPSMLYLLSPALARVGDVDDPSQPSWGGSFRRENAEKYPNYWVDLYPGDPDACQQTIARWRVDFLRHWKARWDWYP